MKNLFRRKAHVFPHRPQGPNNRSLSAVKRDESEDYEDDDELDDEESESDETDQEIDEADQDDDETTEMTTESKPTAEEINTAWEHGMLVRAEQNGGLVPGWEEDPAHEGRQRHVRLRDAKMPANTASETEALLNLLIEDCHFLIREIAFHSARLTPDQGARLGFIRVAGELAEQGAKVAGAIATLRSGAPVVEERRQRVIVEHVQTIRGEGGTP
jgi:hypothetical protein